MKNLSVMSPLLASLLLGAMALAQEPMQIPEAPQPQNTTENRQPTEAKDEDSGGKDVVSQFRRYPQIHRGQIRATRGPAYSSAYAPTPPPFSPLGALIGFGVGAAIGASGSDRSGTTLGGRVIIGGTIFAVIGGVIGTAFPHVRRHYPSHGPDDDDDDESDLRSDSRLGSDSRLERSGRSVITRPSPAQSTQVEMTNTATSHAPTVP